MSRGLKNLTESLASSSRQVAALGVLFLAVRLAWLAGTDVVAHAKKETVTEVHRSTPVEAAETPAAQATGLPQRPDFDELKKQIADATNTNPDFEDDKPKGPQTRLRRILVDLGPERSDVYVSGRKVGQTPYLGQISCLDGTELKIQVLPPSGAPIQRTAICHGETVTAAR